MPTLYKLQSALSERDFDPIAVMHDQESIRNNTFNEGGYTQETFDFLSEQFKHHANFLSLSTIRSYDTLSQHRWITSTDGLIPLVDFFIRFSRPGNSLKTVILVPRELKAWVPRIWSDNIMLYTVDRKNIENVSTHNLFIGIADQGLNTAIELANEFKSYKEKASQTENSSILLLNPKHMIIPSEITRPYSHVRELINSMDSRDHFELSSKILNQELISQTTFHFSKKIKYLKIYSELEQKLLSFGASPLDKYHRDEEEQVRLPISAYHDLIISDCETYETDEQWDKINYDVSRLGVVDNLIGQDMCKLLMKQALHIGTFSD